MAEEYRRTISELAELAGGLAHELRNPLSTMMVNLKLLAEDLRDATVHPDDVRRRALLKVDVLRREAERLQTLFDEFLNLTSPCRLQRKSSDLSTIVTRLVDFVTPLARNQGIKLEISGTERPRPCRVDEKLLSQALLNIVVNAQEALPEGGRIRLAVERQGEEFVIAVTDTGGGIAPEDRERIFRPFFSTKRQGTGLGLSITRRVVREHGGTLEMETELGKGTTFRIRIPFESSEGNSAASGP